MSMWAHAQLMWWLASPPRLFDRLYGLAWYREVMSEMGLTTDAQGLQVLELGCGTGAHAWSLAASGALVHGVDLSPRMIRAAQRQGPVSTPGLVAPTFRVADAADLPWPEAQFDRIGAASLLNVVSDPGAVLRECHRVCRPGGTIHLLFPSKGFDPAQVRRWAADRGLQGVSAAAYLNWYRMARKLDATEVLVWLTRAGWRVESTGSSLGGWVQRVVARA